MTNPQPPEKLPEKPEKVEPEARWRVVDEHAENTPHPAPIIEWEDFLNNKFHWKQGEHVACVGPTGGGKTTLALNIIGRRQFVTVLATKPQDEVLENLEHIDKFRRMDRWKDYDPIRVPKRVIWPDATDLYSAVNQQRAFREAMRYMYRQGGWCIYIDELWYIIHHLKLDLEVRTFLQQSRSIRVSLIALTQRPANVPLELYDQSTHLFFWLDNDERNLKRLSGISWKSAKLVQNMIANLEHHQVLYINTRTGDMFRFTPPPPVDTKTKGKEKAA